MTGGAVRLRLRVIAGPNRGAEVPLHDGSWVIGSGPDGDIVLSDRAVAGRHLRLDIEGERIRVEPLALPLWLDGRPVERKAFRISPYQCLSLGDSHLALGLADRPWPPLEPPHRMPVAAPGETRAEAEARGAAAALPWRRPAWLSDRLILRAVPALYFIGLILLSQGVTLPVGARLEGTDVVAQAGSVLDGLGLAEAVQVVKDDQGRYRLEGYVPDRQRRRQLREALRKAGLRLETRIWCMDELAHQADEVMHSLGVDHVRVRPGRRGGALVMTGYVTDEGRWRKVLATLRSDIPGVRHIDDSRVDTLARREAVLEGLLAEQGLAQRLEVRAEDGRLVVRGTLSAEERPRWRLVVTAFEGSYGGLPPLEDRTGEAVPADISVPIRSVNIANGVSYVELRDGTKYLPGALLGDGYRLKSIQPDHLVLSRDHRDYVYPFGRK